MPNRPGTLGAVASALGALGADINLVEIVEKRGEIEVEEFILDLPPTQTVEKLVAACDRLESVRVEWVRNYPRGGGIEYDIELHRRIAADPSRAGRSWRQRLPWFSGRSGACCLTFRPHRRSPSAPRVHPTSTPTNCEDSVPSTCSTE